jgi:hypothetical protein
MGATSGIAGSRGAEGERNWGRGSPVRSTTGLSGALLFAFAFAGAAVLPFPFTATLGRHLTTGDISTFPARSAFSA